MRLGNRLLTSCAAVLFLGLVAGAAHATSTGGFPGNGSRCEPIQADVQSGPLWFSNFCFFSPGGSVDPDDLRITFVADADGVVDVVVEGIDPISPNGHGWAKFYITYDVTAVDPIISGVSLALEPSVHSGPAAVFNTTRVIGEGPGGPGGQGGSHHGLGHPGWGLLHKLGDHGDPQGETLAFLKAAAWDAYGGCLCGLSWGWLCSGQSPEDVSSFDPRESLRVIDGIWIKVRKGGDAEFVWSRNRFNVVPEPATAALLALGLLGLAIAGHRL